MVPGDEHWRRGPGLLESVWRYRVLVAAVTLVGGALGYVLGLQQPVGYDATARLFLTDPREPSALDVESARVDPENYVPQQAARVRSRPVVVEAIERLDRDLSVQDLRDRFAVAPLPELLVLEITGSDATAEGAAGVANAVASAYMAVVREEQTARAADAAAILDPELEALALQVQGLEEELATDPANLALTRQISVLTERLTQVEIARRDLLLQAQLFGSGVDLFEAAVDPGAPARPNPETSAILVALLSFVLATMFAYWRAARSRRVTQRSDAEAILGAPLLGEIPLHTTSPTGSLGERVRLDPVASESYEFVLASIEFALAEIGGRSLLVTSALPSDGKTLTVLQLSMAASRDERRVVLVDADIRVRGLSRLLQAEDLAGLTDLATTPDLEPDECMRRYRFSEQSLVPVMGAGRGRVDPTSFFRSPAFRTAMERVRAQAELAIVDSSPVLAVADATIAAGAVDALVLVVSHGTLVSDLEKVRERLAFVSTPLLGYIFNRAQGRTPGAYGYRYEAPPAEASRGRRQPSTPRASRRRRPEPAPAPADVAP